MLAILLDTLAAYLLRKYFSTKLQYFFFGIIAGVINSAVSAFLMGALLNETPSAVVVSALSGAFLHPILIFIFLYIDLRFISKKLKRNAAIAAANAEDEYWDANEGRIIDEVLKSHQSIDLSVAERNEILEDNLARLPTEEIIEKIKRKHFAEDAIPSVLRVLSSRKKA